MHHTEYDLEPGRAIPAITIRQPWATLITRKEKKFETRPWTPNPDRLDVGDEVAIHSAKAWTVEQKHLCQEDPAVRRALVNCHRVPGERAHAAECVPRGRVLSICTLDEILTAQEARERAEREDTFFPRLGLGDYSEGRYAWRLVVEYIYSTPQPSRGQQRLWTWQVLADRDRS